MTPEAVGKDEDEALLDEAAREKLLRPRAWPPTPAAAAAMGVRRRPLLLLWARARDGWCESNLLLGLSRFHIHMGRSRALLLRRVTG